MAAVERCRQRAQAYAERAESIIRDYLDHGWDGLAEQIDQAGQTLQHLAEAIADARDTISSALAAVERASATTGLGNLRQHLGGAVEGLGRGVDMLASAAQASDDAATAAQPAHAGFAGSLIDLRDDLISTTEQLHQGHTALEAEHQAAAQFGSPHTPEHPPGPDVPDAPGPWGKPGPGVIPDWVRVAGARLPSRQGDKRAKTTGIVLDPVNGRAAGPEIVSGEDRGLVQDLALRTPRLKFATSLLSHVESHVAAGVRRGLFARESLLVINNRPCRDQLGCDTLLPYILPRGAVLHVYVAHEDGTSHFRTYEGNGELIKP
ncbi:hypothetical protein KIH74_06890 [Kineosporia sp. J2-2]|uniref:Nucleic acid/nucleotide deaminase of polymorphic system toxin n=1 Tax=Kineosporia corallincola TaxID=2835133 RepID=A0ABS5TC42_9ACTN|nr:DddA-like double-stranded DNA deaminase toxin [Kineosporia corallincola]MBT0768646.1 hypothetical protein [Kineosporia corallincola]